jgi:hypothetical protein
MHILIEFPAMARRKHKILMFQHQFLTEMCSLFIRRMNFFISNDKYTIHCDTKAMREKTFPKYPKLQITICEVSKFLEKCLEVANFFLFENFLQW